MPPEPFILIPPSEAKLGGGDGPSWRPGTMCDEALDSARSTVLRAARRAGVVARGAPTMPAMLRYDGVLYGELAWSTLPVAPRRRGNTRVRIVSGLMGLVAPDDPIPAYRLKMSARLTETGRLASWWRPQLAPVLADLSRGAVVWDLLPNEHEAACDWTTAVPRQRITVQFLDRSGRTVSHWNKLLKGSLVRWILEHRPTGPSDLVDFDHPQGYRYDETASTVGPDRAEVVLRATR